MDKVFLSHSSVDKPYVGYIAEQFGKDRCVYDAMCFEAGMKNLDEIFKGIDESEIFVVFISDASLKSEWVQRELSIAENRLNHDQSKLSQIFPVIVDENITHKDTRIPEFMRRGFDSYNLRVLKRREIAYRKINAQLIKRLLERNRIFQKKYNTFYGRDVEVTQFKRSFDSGKPIKCVIASGIAGIGRKTYIIETLKNAKIIEPYYEPAIISLDKLDGIDDLIVKLYEVGFGQYSITSISSLTSMSQKINALTEALLEVQTHQEHIVIYDNECLIRNDNELRFWFMQALERIRNEVTVSIASSHHISDSFARKHTEIFHISLLTLSYPGWNGLLRTYSDAIGIKFDNEDREYFKDIITGYPPQVIYCADLAKDNGIDYVKQYPEKIVSFASASATRILETTVPPELLDLTYGFLSFLSVYGSVPTEILKDIFTLNADYETVYRNLRSLTICRLEGSSGEYIVVNPLVGDYMQRSQVNLPNDISDLLKTRLENFNSNINDPLFVEKEDFEHVRYYLKENLKSGQPIPEKYMYSTLYLKAVYELYNRQKYTQVIDMVANLKDSGAFDRYDIPIQDRLQGYFCRALARQKSPSFYVEVEFFNRYSRNFSQKADYIEYNFLRGFMHRFEGRYDLALTRYNNVLSQRKNHQGAMREIVIVYKEMEDYESAFVYAQLNYKDYPENPFQIQPYFEMLVRRQSLSKEEFTDLAKMQDVLKRMNSITPISIYYELMAQYALYVEKDEFRARAFLSEGYDNFKDSSFMARTAFNCYERLRDIPNMEKSLEILRHAAKNNRSIEPAVAIRQAVFDAYQNKPQRTVLSSIDRISGITEDSKKRLREKVIAIFQEINRFPRYNIEYR